MMSQAKPSTTLSGVVREDITAQSRLISDSNKQRLDALVNANAVRLARAEVKKRVEAGEICFDELLDDTPNCARSVPIRKVLTWFPRVGDKTAKRWVAILELKSGEDTLESLPTRAKYQLSAMMHELCAE